MRRVSFSLVSWLGPASPFLFVWVLNTVDAMLLTWCAALRKDAAYTLLKGFWIVIGIIGIVSGLHVPEGRCTHAFVNDCCEACWCEACLCEACRCEQFGQGSL
ncbi:MAG: hypothetical protein ACRDAP_14580, partial [Shewanella sp.]